MYAGEGRRYEWRKLLAKLEKHPPEVVGFDLLNLTAVGEEASEERTERWQEVDAAEFEVVWVESHYASWTRLLYASPGARPIRSREHQLGFPWLQGRNLRRARRGNAQVDFAIRLMIRARRASLARRKPVLLFWEMPEDLGGHTLGDPGSPWTLRRVRSLMQMKRMTCFAYRKCAFDALPGPEPTRVMTDIPGLTDLGHEGWPSFDKEMRYLGPLPPGCGHPHEVRETERRARGPPEERMAMDGWYEAVATKILKALRESPKEGPTDARPADSGLRHGRPADKWEEWTVPKKHAPKEGPPGTDRATEDEIPVEEEDRYNAEGWWGQGPPSKVRQRKRTRPLESGGGLCDPGRWPPTRRRYPDDAAVERIREQLEAMILRWEHRLGGPERLRNLFYALVRKKVEASPIPDDLLGDLAKGVDAVLSAQGFHPETRNEDTPQVFQIRRLQAALQICQDPDEKILDEYAVGVWLGVDKPLPRTPAVFSRKTKWRLREEEAALRTDWKDNYTSAEEHKDVLKKQFTKDYASGRIVFWRLSEARAFYGDRLAVGALGVIEEGPEKFRIIHDGSHEIKVNHRIRVLDQLATPLAADMMSVQREIHDDQEPLWVTMAGDMTEAHRSVAIREDDWGYQACDPLDEEPVPGIRGTKEDPVVALNTVGTFGMSSAAYWWGRVGAMLIRMCHYWMPRKWRKFWLLLFADDFKATAGGREFARTHLAILVILALFWARIKYKKTAGGLRYDWIGYEENIKEFRLGLSLARMTWMTTWIRRTLQSGKVLVADLRSAVGRMGFAAEVLEAERPFLGPLHAWMAVVPDGAYLDLPVMARLILSWLVRRWEANRTVSTLRRGVSVGHAFRADAKAADDDEGRPMAAIGGWECRGACVTGKARWFSVTLNPQNAPWAFEPKHPKRRIAALELLATLLCVILFDNPGDPAAEGTLLMSGGTDNQGNGFVVDRLMSTKFPLNIVLMELSAQLAERQLQLELEWLPRTENVEADDLTNSEFAKFDKANRIEVKLEDIQWLVLPEMMAEGRQLYSELELAKERFKEEEQKAGQPGPRPAKRRREAMRTREPW